MKEIRDAETSIQEANKIVGQELESGVWSLLVSQMNYPDIKVDEEKGVITYPEFIPFAELFAESVKDLEKGKIDARSCLSCKRYYDVNIQQGIFARPNDLEGFICAECANSMSAFKFFHEYLTSGSS